MRGKEEVINDVLHDYNSQIKTWLKTRLNGAWENGYCHGKDDALGKFLNNHKPITHYDQIVSKSPEELAEWLAEVLFHCSNTICDERCPMYKCCCDQPSDNILDWLNAEANEM